MKKILSILCAILLFHNSCAIPVESEVQTRGLIDSLINSIWGAISALTNGALNTFTGFLQTINTIFNTTANGLQTLANDTTQTLSQTTQSAISIFNKLIAIPAGLGSQIQSALTNSNPNAGLSAITNQLNSLVNTLGSGINTTAIVDPATAAALQGPFSNLVNLKKAIVNNVTAAAQAATSGFNMFFPLPLSKVLGDPTLGAIQQAIQLGVSMINNSTTAFMAAVKNNPFSTFINDVIVAPTNNALTAAFAGIQNIVAQVIGTATNATQGIISTALSGLNNSVPTVVSNIGQILSNVNSTVTTALDQAKTLSAGAQVAAQQQIQAAVGNLTQIVGALQTNLTQAIQTVIGQISSQVQTSVTNVTSLTQDIAKQVVTALISSKLQAKATALTTLAKLLPIVQNGLSGFVNCTTQAVAALQNNTNTVVAALNGTAALLAQNIQMCLNQTTGAAVISCFNVSISYYIVLSQIFY